MIPFPFQVAQFGRALASGGSVSYVAATGANYVASGTTISSPNTPAGVTTGDGLFAIVFARSALTPPAGWSLVASQANTGTLTQTLYLYRRDSASSGDSSTAFTWGQASSGRMGLAYILARSSTGALTVAQSSGAETDVASSTAYPHTVNIPALTAGASGELFLLCATSEAASSTASDNTWAFSGATACTTQPQAENRLGAFTQNRNSGQSNASTGSLSITVAGTNYYSAIAARLQTA